MKVRCTVLNGSIFTADVKNICNLIGRVEYNICFIVLPAPILYSSTKKQQPSNFVAGKTKLMINE